MLNGIDAIASLTKRAVVLAVKSGLSMRPKRLPSWLLYDATGSALYEKITELPEYYLTRAETEIFRDHADAIIADASDGARRLAIAEIGAGTAQKTELLLDAVVKKQGSCVYLACDISELALLELAARMPDRLPTVDVRVALCSHEEAAVLVGGLADRQVLLFIGSSIGNYTDAEAMALLRRMRGYMRDDAVLVLGTDVTHDRKLLQLAYDDPHGVTAAFNKNLLERCNREIGTDFEPARFRHVCELDDGAANVELFLESLEDQLVRIDDVDVLIRKGERIHTETSAKYDLARVDRILSMSGFARSSTYHDERARFAVHVAHAVPARADDVHDMERERDRLDDD